jgi:hypothetical protein
MFLRDLGMVLARDLETVRFFVKKRREIGAAPLMCWGRYGGFMYLFTGVV